MVVKEYGADREKTVLLLHGGGLSFWNFREEAALLAPDYHVILPILDGHAGSDRPFTSIEDNASELLSYIDERLGGSVLFIGGLSLGGQILLELLTMRGDVCRYALIESAAVIPSRLTNALIAPSIGCSFGLIRNRGFARMQFRYLRIRDALFDAYYRDTCRIEKRDMIAFLRANTSYALKDSIRSASAEVHVCYGEKETMEIRRSADRICRTLPSCRRHCLRGLTHGAFSLNHAERYAALVRRITGEEEGV